MRLAQVHSTDTARKWFSVDFAVGGFGFKEDIACKLGAQVSQPFAHAAAFSTYSRVDQRTSQHNF